MDRAAIELFAWNPPHYRSRSRVGRKLRLPYRPLNNFGDMLGPEIVHRLLLGKLVNPDNATRSGRLLSVGSVLHFAHNGDVVWGTGVNGNIRAEDHAYTRLDVRAVRGPLTRQFLLERGIDCPPVYGDPAQLLPLLWPDFADVKKRREVAVVPHLADRRKRNMIDVRRDWRQVVAEIAASEMVVSSSLHGLIVAEAFGVPARALEPSVEAPFKYLDYYRATGRETYTPAETVTDAVRMGAEPPPDWDPRPLLAAFPWDLWAEPLLVAELRERPLPPTQTRILSKLLAPGG